MTRVEDVGSRRLAARSASKDDNPAAPGAAAPDEQEPGAAARTPVEHYFSARPASAGDDREVRLVVDGQAVLLTSGRGVFSSDRIDPGTSVLIQHAPHPPTSGSVLDLGCGYGPIACAIALRSPRADVLAIDVNERAVELTQTNAQRLGLDRLHAMQPERVEPTLRFAAIYSNPPIRVGKAVLHELLTTWLDRLEPSGRAYLVVHRHLGSDSLQRWLHEQSYAVERRVSVRGYRLLQVGPRPGPPSDSPG